MPLSIAKDSVFHERTKHIGVCYHFIRQTVEEGHIKLQYCPTDDMIADVLTKLLARQKFKSLWKRWHCVNELHTSRGGSVGHTVLLQPDPHTMLCIMRIFTGADIHKPASRVMVKSDLHFCQCAPLCITCDISD